MNSKPLICPMPRQTWVGLRVADLCQSIVEYVQSGRIPDTELEDELSEHLEWLRAHKENADD